MKIFFELVAFFWVRRKIWLLPLVLILLILGSILIFAKGSVVAPFIYTIF